MNAKDPGKRFEFSAETTNSRHNTLSCQKLNHNHKVQCYLNTASGSSGSTLIVTGLPFVVASGNNYQYGTGRLGGASYNNSQHMITFEFTTGNSYFIPKVSDGNINWGMLSGTHLMMSGCYQTN